MMKCCRSLLDKDSLGLLSEGEDKSCISSESASLCGPSNKSQRFCQYLADNVPENNLAKLFEDDAGIECTKDGYLFGSMSD